MYSILIQDKKNNGHFSFLQVKKEVMHETVEKVEDDSGNLIDKIVYTPTGQFENVIYEEESRDKFEEKCIDLLNTYNRTEIVPVSLEEYDVDLLWNSDNV